MAENKDHPGLAGGQVGGLAVARSLFLVQSLTIQNLTVNLNASTKARPFNHGVSRALDALIALVDEVPGLHLPLRPLKQALEDAIFAGEVAV